MSSRKSLLITALCLLCISNVSSAVMCHRLKSLSAGESHTLGLADDKSLWACGGDNYYENGYQLGLGSGVTQSLTLKQVKGENGVGYLGNIVTYDAGWGHSLAADVNGTIWSWGYDAVGQLGNGPGQQDSAEPNKVKGFGGVDFLNHIVYVSAGRSGTHSLAVDSNGYVYAWGNNNYGQCGDGYTGGQRDYPVLVWDSNSQTTGRYLGDETHVIAVDAGMNHSLALDANGHVWHWGRYSSTVAYPEKVKTSSGEVLSNIVQISSYDHSVAVDINGNVWEWTSSNGAYKVHGVEMGTTYLENIVEVSAGYGYPTYSGYSMARTIYGYVLVWNAGQNAYPEYVTDGEMETKSGLLEGIISINAGYYDHKLAVCENGFGWAWGTNNSYGQFGVGDDDPHPEPTQMLCTEDPNSIILTKTDDVNDANCVLPGDYITYTITYDANGNGDANVVITDYLPEEVTYLDVEIGEPFFLICNYDEERHVFIWDIGDVGPNETNSIGIIVQVNNLAEPLGELRNRAILEGDTSFDVAEITTPVCCWNPGVIYVDCDRWGGANTGMSWENAYRDLNDALARARHGCGSEIWVAAGTYRRPIQQGESATFELVSGIPVYGHFAGNETSINQRNLRNPNNETILTGLLDNYPTYAFNVVTASNVSAETILDGFAITEGSQAGINITGGSPTISSCNIRANLWHGICSGESHVTVSNCTIADNGYDGINIPQTFVAKTVKVKDNFIHNNGTNGTGSGINISFYYTVYPQVTIRNNTILNNAGTGILLSLASSSPAIVTNNIIWGNNTQISGAATVTYCCVQGGYTGANNTSHDPCFINALTDPNDYHLGPASVYCIDKGKPNSTEPNETDLDGEDRVMDGDYNNTFIVDIGADEHFFPRADFNRDGIVNFFDYAIFAFAWGEPNSDVNLAGDIDIEMDDLAAFCADWLWIAPWSDLYETLMSQADSGMNMFIAEQSMAVEADMLESSEMSLSFDEQLVPAESPDIVRLIDWLDDAWLAGEITEALTEQEYLDFRQSLADSAE